MHAGILLLLIWAGQNLCPTLMKTETMPLETDRMRPMRVWHKRLRWSMFLLAEVQFRAIRKPTLPMVHSAATPSSLGTWESGVSRFAVHDRRTVGNAREVFIVQRHGSDTFTATGLAQTNISRSAFWHIGTTVTFGARCAPNVASGSRSDLPRCQWSRGRITGEKTKKKNDKITSKNSTYFT